MLGVIYVETNPFLSLRCITSIRTFRLAPFSPIVDNNVLNRFNLASSRLEVEGVVGVEGFLSCGVVGVEGAVCLYGCPSKRNPNKRCILIIFRFRKVSLSTSIHDSTNTTTPILQECSLEEYIGNGWVLWEGVIML